MLRDLLSSRAILVGIVCFVLIVGGTQLYRWHALCITDPKLERHDSFLQRVEKLNETPLAQDTVGTSTEAETPVFSNDAQPVVDDTSVAPSDAASEFTDKTVVVLPNDIAPAKEAAEGRMSPHGFGPYPEVPEDFVAAKGITSWQATELFGTPPVGPELELGFRVLVKLWKQGDTQWTGAVMENGTFYVQYPNRAYVRYKTRQNPDGTTKRYISRWTSSSKTPTPVPGGEEPPPGVEIIDMDTAQVGFDPYTFLGLNP